MTHEDERLIDELFADQPPDCLTDDDLKELALLSLEYDNETNGEKR